MITSHEEIDRLAREAIAMGADPHEIDDFETIAKAFLGPEPDKTQASPQGQLQYLLGAALAKLYGAIINAKNETIERLRAENSVLEARLESVRRIVS